MGFGAWRFRSGVEVFAGSLTVAELGRAKRYLAIFARQLWQ